MSAEINGRISALQTVLTEKGLDAAIIYDRENLIYFAGLDELEGGVLCIPCSGESVLYCMAPDASYMREKSGLNVVPYLFPAASPSTKAAEWLSSLKRSAPRVGFTRYFISLKDYQCLRQAVPGMEVCDIAMDCYRLRSRKSPQELAYIRKAAGFLKAGMEAAVECVCPGIRETDVLAEAERAMRHAGSQGASFRMQVLRHDRQFLIHPYAKDYTLNNNEPVVIHLGASFEGYTAKMCRTVFLGEVPEETRAIYRLLGEAQRCGMKALCPGVTCGEVYDAILAPIEQSGYGKLWIEQVGYGVGIRQSEFYPVIARDSKIKLEENMVVDLLLPTIPKPGTGGPRLTDTILLTADGAEYLTDYSRDEITKRFPR